MVTLSGATQIWPVFVAMTLLAAAGILDARSQAMTPNSCRPKHFPTVAFIPCCYEIGHPRSLPGCVLYCSEHRCLQFVGFAWLRLSLLDLHDQTSARDTFHR